MNDLSLVTVATRSHVPGALVTCRSFLDQHPGHRALLLLVDGPAGPADALAGIELLHVDELLDADELTDLRMLYGPFELSTALKPIALLTAIERTGGPVVYLDADILVLAPLDEVLEPVRTSGLGLTPHRFDPVPDDGRLPDEETLLQTGVFNSGLIAAAAAGTPVLRQWWASLRRDCIVAPARQRYVDQRWLDHVVGLHPVTVLRDPGLNVGYWNADSRKIGASPDGFSADGATLRCFHFSGFDPTATWSLSRHIMDRPRVRLSEEPVLAALCRRYAMELINAGWHDARLHDYRYSRLPDGTLIDDRMRRVFRRALEVADRGGPRPPNPFRRGQVAAFWAMLQTPPPSHPRVSRYLLEVWRDRPDVAAMVGSLEGAAADRFLDWILDHGIDEADIPPRLLPERPMLSAFRASSLPPPTRHPGLAIAGLLDAHLGVGQAARLAVDVARAAGLEPEVIGYNNTLSPQDVATPTIDPLEATADVALVCLNPDVLSNFMDAAWPTFRTGRRTVGLWFWEVDVAPASFGRAFDLVDEVWVTTEHVRRALEPIATKPVELVPLPLVAATSPAPEADPRPALALPTDRFTFLFSYDSLSVPERKNPLGLLQAFCEAFEPDEGPILIIKTMNGAGHPVTEQLLQQASSRPDVRVVDADLPAPTLRALTAAADCYVSLHRAEGWGLTMAEAMAAGTPVIATGYSGNLDFMTDENSILVPYQLCSVGPGADPYPPDAVWAEPDLGAAAAAMRAVHDDPTTAAARSERAKRDIMEGHRPAAVAAPFTRAVEHARDRGPASP